MKISLFNPPVPGQPHKAEAEIDIDDFLNAVKFGRWKDQVQAIRQVEDKERRNALKKNLPSVTISGTFDIRRADGVKAHSGFIAIDIDGWNDRGPLVKDQFTYALFQSVSGNGLVVVARINPDKHKDSFRFLAHHYFATYGISVDPAPSSVASLRYVSYDPEMYINLRAAKARTKAEPRTAPKSLPVVLPQSDALSLCQQVAGEGIDIAPDYESYFRLALSVASGFGESGREMFHLLCQPSPRYNSAQADVKYTAALRDVQSGNSRTTVGTMYYMLKQAGVQIPRTSQKAVQVVAMGKAGGRSEEALINQLVTINGVPTAQAEELVKEVMRRDDIDLRKVAADPENLIECLQEWMVANHPIRRNAITGMLEEAGSEVTAERMNTIYLRARSAFNRAEVTFDLVKRMLLSDITPTFNPILEYIERNRYRNSSGNIDRLIKTIRTDGEGAPTFIRKWVLSWIAAVHGHPVRGVLTLCGGQHNGKTEWFRRLPPGGLRRFYAESKLDAGKDDDLLMCQRLWVMDDEMGGKSKQDEKRFKELTSKTTFTLRAPYAEHNRDYKRMAVLCGTSNDFEVINDPTGNTRIMPVRVLSIDYEGYNAIDKDELFMEAVRAYESGEPWMLDVDDLKMLEVVSRDFEGTPFERELICKFFRPVSQNEAPSFYTATEIKDVIETQTRQRIMSMKRFGIELRRLFGDRISTRKNGYPVSAYRCERVYQGDISGVEAPF